LDAAKNHPHMKAPLGKNQGRGMACGFWFNFGGQTCTDLNIGMDGSVSLAVGTIDVGGSRASLSLVAAEELGIDYSQVKAVVADTSSLGYNDMTDGSRGTFSSSMATISAARNAIKPCANARRRRGTFRSTTWSGRKATPSPRARSTAISRRSH
jgi:CO/xanthine dehydrogenase Mo-binding subunit